MQEFKNKYKTLVPVDKKFTVETATGTFVHRKVGIVYIGPKNYTVCGLDRRAVARYPRLSVSGISYTVKQ